MAALAETITELNRIPASVEAYQLVPMVVEVPLLLQDELLRARASRFIGNIAVQASLAPTVAAAESAEPPQFTNLLEALVAAKAGNETAVSLVRTNVATHLAETMFKVGPVQPVTQTLTGEGIDQFGQSDLQVQANTLMYSDNDPVMQARTEAETRNAFRKQSFAAQGLLEDNYFVVISRPEDKPNFFTDTMSISLQLTSSDKQVISVESAFVAGKATPDSESKDEALVVQLGAYFGIDFADKTAAEIIDTPLLIPKSMLPNGVIDLVKICDQPGKTFYGEAKPIEDYNVHQAAHFAHQASFAPRVELVTNRLIAEALTIKDPIMATERLHKLSEAELVEVAVIDQKVNPLVLGEVAAKHVEMARLYIENGDVANVLSSTQAAKQTAKSSSCPTSLRSTLNASDSNEESSDKSSGKKEKMKCPFCGDPDQSGDPCSSHQYCNNCDARVRNGRVVSKGNGGRKKKLAAVTKAPKNPVAEAGKTILR